MGEPEDDTESKYYFLEVEFFKLKNHLNLNHFKDYKILETSRPGRHRIRIMDPGDIKYKCIFLSCEHFDSVCGANIYICQKFLNYVTTMQNVPT